MFKKSSSLLLQAVKEALSQFHKAHLFDWELNKKTLGLRGADWVPLVLSTLGLSSEISEEKFFDLWDANLAKLTDLVEAMPGAKDLVSYFHSQHIPLAVATSSTSLAFNKKRARHTDMFEKFDIFVCGDDPEVRRLVELLKAFYILN